MRLCRTGAPAASTLDAVPRRAHSVLVLLLALAAAAPVRGAALESLNNQRTANGIPAGIVERADWSSACAKHDNYMAQNNELTHTEDSSKPGYTADGAWAGQNSVLAQGSSWADANPFETAPIHLMQLLAPRLSELGQDESQGYVCDTTWPGMNRARPAAPVIYTYPGDGRTDVRASEVAYESPFVPGDFVGLPAGTRTGPHLYVLADGPWDNADAKITAASLTGPDGPVDVKWVDNTTDTIGPYLPTGGIVIPSAPLRRGNVGYTASVTVAIDDTSTTHTWSFTTVANAPPVADFSVTPAAPRAGRTITLQSTSTDADGTIATVSWDVRDDGRPDGTAPTLSFRFPKAGFYKLRLRVTDNDGAAADKLVTIAVAGRSASAAACVRLAGQITAVRRAIRRHAKDHTPKAQAKRTRHLRTLQRQDRTRCGP